MRRGRSGPPPRRAIPAPDDGDVVTKESPHPFDETVAGLLELLGSKGLKVFAVIDQKAEAHEVGLDLRPTTLVVFGNPAAGTGVMAAEPLAALDLPLKILVWVDSERGTLVSYVAPAAIAARYGLGPELRAALEPIHGLTDAVVAP